MKHCIAALVALVLIGFITRDALDVGFLADDWYLGERIVVDQNEHPGLANRLVRSVTNTWAPTFEVVRPLTILSVELDYEIFGADPGKHHYQSMIWWGALALILGHVVCKRMQVKGAVWPAVLAVWFGSYPGCTEALAWLVARQDLILGVSAAAALGCVMLAPARGWRLALLTVPGYLGKETAIVLAPMLLLTDLILHPRSNGASVRSHVLSKLRTHAPVFGVAALYLAARWCLFGRALGAYNGKSMLEHLADRPGLLSVIGEALRSGSFLFRPANATVMDSLAAQGVSVWSAVLVPAGAAVLVLFGFASRSAGVTLAASVRTVARDGLVVVVWTLVPLTLLAIPGNGVTPDLAQGRFLVLPFIALAVASGSLVARVINARPGVVIPLLAASAMTGASIWRVNLDAFRHATARANTIAAGLIDGVKAPGVILLDGWWAESPGGGVAAPQPYVNICDGAYVFGGAIGSAARPPFVPPPGMEVRLLTPDQVRSRAGAPSELAMWMTQGASPPVLKRLELHLDEPRVVDAFPRQADFTLANAVPFHGSSLRRDQDPTFRFEFDVPAGVDSIAVCVAVPSGETAVADIPLDPATRSSGGRVAMNVPGARFQLVVGDRVVDHPLDSAILGAVKHDVVLWWVEYEVDEAHPVRSQALAVRLR